jgi:dihydrofolate reductase
MIPFSIVVAIDNQRGIGKAGQLPWHLPGDLQFFKTLTTGHCQPGQVNAVIMGRRTWESLPEKYRPLPGRKNVVISRNSYMVLPDGVSRVGSLDEALELLTNEVPCINQVFVIGGETVYKSALNHRLCQKVYLTQINQQYSCDVFFPALPECFTLKSRTSQYEENHISYAFLEYEKRNLS